MTAAVLLALIFVVLSRIRPVAGDPVAVDGVWTETVKKGSMLWEVRGAGTIIRTAVSSKPFASVQLANTPRASVGLNQMAEVAVGKIVVKGRVSFIGAPLSDGNYFVDIALNGSLPEGVDLGQHVEAAIQLGELKNVLYVARPVHAHANKTMSVFRIIDNGEQAERVVAKFGRASRDTLEVLGGLKEGDKIISGDMSAWEQYDRIRLR